MQTSEIITAIQGHDKAIAETNNRVTKLEDIVKGDGVKAGLGPMTLDHHEAINGEDGLKKQVRKLQDNSIKTAAWVGGAVFVATIVANIAITIVSKFVK